MIREGVGRLLKEMFGIEEVPLNIPPKREMGDLSSAICLSIAKQKRRPPMEIDRQAAQLLRSTPPPFVYEIGVSPPGHLNFKVDWPGLAGDLIPRVLEKGIHFGKPALVGGGKGFIEHTGVNPN